MSETRIPYPEGPSDPAALNIERMYPHMADDMRAGFNAFSRAVMGSASLDPQLREIAILRVGHLSDCAYEQHQHAGYSRYLGMSEEVIAVVKDGAESPVFGAREKALIRFVDDLVQGVRPGDASLEGMRAHFSMAEIFTALLTTCQYMTVCRILETTGVPIEDQAGLQIARLNAAKG